MSMKKWWIGCSGLYYKHWRDTFYPKGLPQRKWFGFYCESSNIVELNVTFTGIPHWKLWRDGITEALKISASR